MISKYDIVWRYNQVINGGFQEVEPSVFIHEDSGKEFTSIADAYIYLEVIQEVEDDEDS